MRRIVSIVVAVALGLSLYGFGAPTAKAYTPGNSQVFNNIKSKSKARQEAIIRHIDRSVNAAPKGSTIHIAQYLFDMKSSADALIRAHRRGVNVKFLIDDGMKSRQLTRLRSVLGTNKNARSFVAKCRRGCMSNQPSTIHAKFYLFSHVGRARNVSMIASGNQHHVNVYNSWNDIKTIPNNRTIYNSLRRYFDDMLKDRTNHDYYRTTTSGKYKLYFYPQRLSRGEQALQLAVLNNVSCRRVAKGYGSKGRTYIRVGMYGWTVHRNDVARRLWELHDQGCRVEVILNRARTGISPLRWLLKRSKRHGVMRVHDAFVDKNNNNIAGRYMHFKMMMISGRWFGKGNVKVVYTGSQNLTRQGFETNNDLVLRIRDNATYNAYSRQMDYIRSKTKRITRAPARSAANEIDPGIYAELLLDR